MLYLSEYLSQHSAWLLIVRKHGLILGYRPLVPQFAPLKKAKQSQTTITVRSPLMYLSIAAGSSMPIPFPDPGASDGQSPSKRNIYRFDFFIIWNGFQRSAQGFGMRWNQVYIERFKDHQPEAPEHSFSDLIWKRHKSWLESVVKYLISLLLHRLCNTLSVFPSARCEFLSFFWGVWFWSLRCKIIFTFPISCGIDRMYTWGNENNHSIVSW